VCYKAILAFIQAWIWLIGLARVKFCLCAPRFIIRCAPHPLAKRWIGSSRAESKDGLYARKISFVTG
jgi:hypothetical protein